MSVPAKIIELRQLLAERFPHASRNAQAVPATEIYATGMSGLDALLNGGLPRGELNELVGAGPGSGSAQVIHRLLHQTAANGQFLALVDGVDSFDVDAVEPEVLTRLLWVRCQNADEALKATDLLLRDRNFPVVVLDLKLNPVAQLRKISSATWFRLSRLLEQNAATVLVVTPHPLVGHAAWRVRVESGLGVEALKQPPREVPLQFTLLRAAMAGEQSKVQAG
jgi:hypothetical protein